MRRDITYSVWCKRRDVGRLTKVTFKNAACFSNLRSPGEYNEFRWLVPEVNNAASFRDMRNIFNENVSIEAVEYRPDVSPEYQELRLFFFKYLLDNCEGITNKTPRDMLNNGIVVSANIPTLDLIFTLSMSRLIYEAPLVVEKMYNLIYEGFNERLAFLVSVCVSVYSNPNHIPVTPSTISLRSALSWVYKGASPHKKQSPLYSEVMEYRGLNREYWGDEDENKIEWNNPASSFYGIVQSKGERGMKKEYNTEELAEKYIN